MIPIRRFFILRDALDNEAAFLYQLYARLLGTNNLPDCSNMCHESSGRGLGETIGTGKGTVQLSDFEHADCILVIGQNWYKPSTYAYSSRRSSFAGLRNYFELIHFVNVAWSVLLSSKTLALLGRSTAISTEYLQVQINGDVALLKG